MMPHLRRLTKNDYRDYRRTFQKVKYSIFDTNQTYTDLLSLNEFHECYQNVVLGKGDFFDVIENPNDALYFYENDSNEILGIIILYFKNKTCTIAEFAVIEQGKGNGTAMYTEIENLCRKKGVYDLELWSPFEGSSQFWSKMGFYERKPMQFYKRISKS